MPALIRSLLSVTSSFQVALTEIKKQKIAENFEKEFQEVLEVLKKASHSRKQLLNHLQELEARLSLNKTELTDTEKRCEEAEKNSEKLTQDLCKACKCIEDHKEKEVNYKGRISELEIKLYNLENEIDDTLPEKEQAFELEAERERKLLNSRINQLESDLKIKESAEQEVKLKLVVAVEAMEKLEENVEALRIRLKQELGRSQVIVKDGHYTKNEVLAKEDRIMELEEIVSSLKWKIEDTGKTISSYEQRIMNHEQKLTSLQKLFQNTQKIAQIQVEEFKNMSAEKDKLALLIERKDEDLKTLNGKLIDALNEKESILQKHLFAQNQKQSSEAKCGSLEKLLQNSEREVSKLKKQQYQHDSEISSLIREKEVLAKNILKMESIVEGHSNQLKSKEKERTALYQDLKDSQIRIEKQNKIISTLEGMKIQLLKDIKNLTKKIETLNNDLSVAEEKEAKLQREVVELTSHLAQQKDISSGAILDRKIFCQQYKEVKENRDQLKQKIEILDNYVKDLRDSQLSQSEEISNWEKKWELINLHNNKLQAKLAQEENTHTALKISHKYLNEQLQSNIQIIANKEKETKHLQLNINQLSEECMMLRSQQQSNRKELLALEEKLKNSENAIIREQELYLSLKHGTKLLHLEILRLTGEKNSLMCKVNDLQKLKDSFTHAKQELHNERYKNIALEAAMQQPLNVHRWRLLKGTDPEKYELIENYQTAQKQLLKKSIETEKEKKKLTNMVKLVDHLKSMTTKGKYFEEKCLKAADQKNILKEKKNKIKALSFELNMNETYMSSYQAEISRLKDEVRQLKLKQFFADKKIVPVQQ
ncbi:hypothetical protein JTE90_017560 [Oedothorax gibbosus]|uniref:Uncharacterized protein n=1 Tax=Oedothorax gibbosus TaxID=931172 RepID=A0AAV6UPP8_9ARAC|nr:hypothetical protein JTE90_017560 [Oedothorax gibbosus]